MKRRGKTKGKGTKKVAPRKTVTAAKKARVAAPTASAPKAAVPQGVESRGTIDLLRAWSPSRYSTR